MSRLSMYEAVTNSAFLSEVNKVNTLHRNQSEDIGNGKDKDNYNDKILCISIDIYRDVHLILFSCRDNDAPWFIASQPLSDLGDKMCERSLLIRFHVLSLFKIHVSHIISVLIIIG